jgi:hypothetical protein
MRYLSSALLVLLTTAGMAAPPETVPTDLYMPLVPGMVWEYEDQHRDRPVLVKATREEDRTGPAVRVDSDSIDLARVFRVSEGGRLLLQEVAVTGRIHDYREEPIPFASGPEIEVPSTYEFVPASFRNAVTGRPTHWKIEVRRLVEHEVAYGAIRECLEVRIRVLEWRSGKRLSSLVMYFAPGIGLVEERGFHFGVLIDRKLAWFYRPPDESGVE